MTDPVRDDVAALASTPVTIDSEATVVEAAQMMWSEHIGSLVVMEAGEPAGLVTDRDATLAALLRPAGSAVPTVGSAASRPLISIGAEASLVDATMQFRRHCVRRVGVLDASGTLIGILAADSVLQALGRPLDDLSRALTREFQEERSPSPTAQSTFGPE